MADRIINSKVCLRTDSAANWNTVNPILLKGELGVEYDTCRIKIGDGVKKWKDLQYFFATTISRQEIINLIYPVNVVIAIANNVNPADLIGGVWRETKVIAISEIKYWIRVE